MTELNYKEKIDLINKYVDQEDVFRYANFNVKKGFVTNPYRNDKKAGCYFKWYKNVLWFFDWTCPFQGETLQGNGINLYGAIKLKAGLPLGKQSNKDAIDIIIDRFVWGLAETEKEQKAKMIQSKNKKKTESDKDVIEIKEKHKSLPRINYFSSYHLNTSILKKEGVFEVTEYSIIKNKRDITRFFPTIEEAQGLIIVYVYGEKRKFYAPLLPKHIKKPRFWGNINASQTIEGYDQIHNPNNRTMILLGSKKDYMVGRYTLHKMKADFYATQNEGSYLPDFFNKKTKMIYENRYVMFDADESGYKNGFKILQHHEFTGQIILPQLYNSEGKLLKDPSDLIEYYDREQTINIFRNSNILPYDKTYREQTHESIAKHLPTIEI